MKRVEVAIAALAGLLVLSAVAAFFTIPPAGPKVVPGAAAPMAAEMDPARRLWAADPARAVYVFGEAVRPGAHEIPAQQTWRLKDLAAAVGGFTPSAAGRARVVRKVQGAITEILNVSKEGLDAAELELRPGDVIYFD